MKKLLFLMAFVIVGSTPFSPLNAQTENGPYVKEPYNDQNQYYPSQYRPSYNENQRGYSDPNPVRRAHPSAPPSYYTHPLPPGEKYHSIS